MCATARKAPERRERAVSGRRKPKPIPIRGSSRKGVLDMSPRCAILTVVFKGGAPRVTKLKAQMESNSQEAKRMLLERGGGSPPRNKSSVGRLRRSDFVQVWGSGRTGVPALAAPGLFLVFSRAPRRAAQFGARAVRQSCFRVYPPLGIRGTRGFSDCRIPPPPPIMNGCSAPVARRVFPILKAPGEGRAVFVPRNAALVRGGSATGSRGSWPSWIGGAAGSANAPTPSTGAPPPRRTRAPGRATRRRRARSSGTGWG